MTVEGNLAVGRGHGKASSSLTTNGNDSMWLGSDKLISTPTPTIMSIYLFSLSIEMEDFIVGAYIEKVKSFVLL